MKISETSINRILPFRSRIMLRRPIITHLVIYGQAVLLVVALGCFGQANSYEGISEEEARAIALASAGCRKPENCLARGRLKDGNWIFVVSFIMGRDRNGEPLVAPGGWIGITINSKGKVIDRMPGA